MPVNGGSTASSCRRGALIQAMSPDPRRDPSDAGANSREALTDRLADAARPGCDVLAYGGLVALMR